MRHSAKLLGWVAATSALIASAIQIPGFSEETRYLRYPNLQLAETKPKVEKDWSEFSQSSPTATKRTHDSSHAAVKTDDGATILQVEGVLEAGDETLQDESLYDTYLFEGQAGQFVQIRLESDDFDTYLILLNPDGEQIAANDDGIGELNSTISVELPQDGTYQVVAHAYDSSGRGEYHLTISEISDSDYRQAVDVEAKKAEADRLLQQGIQQYQHGQFQEALASWEQALELYQEIGDRAGEGNALGNLGNAYLNLGQYERAIDFYKQSLAIAREIGDRSEEFSILAHLGHIFTNLGQYEQALDAYQESLVIAREMGIRDREGAVLSGLGYVYYDLGQYEQALDFHYQSLTIARDIDNDTIEAESLNGLGLIYSDLGQPERSIELHQQYLAISREIGNQWGEANALNSLGVSYYWIGQYEQAVEAHQQALELARTIGDHLTETHALGNLGLAYHSTGQFERSIDLLQDAIPRARDIGNPRAEAIFTGVLGLTYSSSGQYEQAIESFRQAIAISYVIENRSVTGFFLGRLGRTLVDSEQPELAIIFLKASVEVRESIRDNITNLDTTLQQSFTDTVADDYRLLAELLLNQGRIPEAQQVLDLLKLEELREFTHTTRATWNGDSLQYTEVEQPIIDAHGSLIALGQQIYQCRQTRCDDLQSLREQQRTLTAQYETQVTEFAASVASNSQDGLFQAPGDLSDDAYDLLQANPNSVLIYPFVTDDKLWLLWAAAGGAIGSVEIDLSQGELATAVQQFGEHLSRPGDVTALQASSQQLYDWLIKPLKAELQANDIQHLIFVNDRVTRYIPMAALYDGEQYLLEHYTISTVITPAITDTEATLDGIDDSEVLGLGLSQPVAGFSPLPAVPQELDAIIRSDEDDATGIYPGQVLMDDDFTLEAMHANVEFRRVLHIATHAQFEASRAEESFLVLGNGERLSIQEIETMQESLRDLHLVVLSACQTALGGPGGDGTEIAGISSYFLKAGRAETVIASLWAVSDASTSLLMQRFYAILATGEFTKAEALQQAQLSLLYSEDIDALETRLSETRAGARPQLRPGVELPPDIGHRHPYHWAPFILIGNAL